MSINKLGRYEIIEELDRGGMATVYIGYDATTKRRVAVKVLPPQFTHDPQFYDRFQIEAETIALLEHTAIVPVYDYGEDNEFPYLVMRLMLGGTLEARVGDTPLPMQETVTITKRICAALDKAHSKGIIHRDIKPSNILFDEDGYAYLGDFGIVKIAEATRTTQMIGTPEYMAPEQIEDQPLDRRTDVYQMGIVVFEMLTGQQPYTATSTTAVLFKHVRDPIPLIQEFNPQLPASCQGVINKALAKKPQERFATAGALASTLEQAMSQNDLPAVPVLPTKETQEFNAESSAQFMDSVANSRSEHTIDSDAIQAQAIPERDRAKDWIYNHSGFVLWLKWVLASTASLVTVSAFGGFLASSYIVKNGLGPSQIGGVFIVNGIVVGAAVGLIQSLVLRTYIARAIWWIPASALGGIAANQAAGMILNDPNADTASAAFLLYLITLSVISGIVVGLPQWLVLRPFIAKAIWWIPARALGYACSLSISAIMGVGRIESRESVKIVVSSLLSISIAAAITGTALVWLIRDAGLLEKRNDKVNTEPKGV